MKNVDPNYMDLCANGCEVGGATSSELSPCVLDPRHADPPEV